MIKSLVVACALLAACKYAPLPSLSGDDAGGGDDGGGSGSDACVGVGCQVVMCPAGDETRITGTVTLPNGTTPMANVDVYVPATDPGALTPGASCTRCGPLPGNPVVKTRTDAMGRFTLVDVPAGDNIPLVITIGKWRRQLLLPHVNECEETALQTPNTHLPKNRAEMTGDTVSVDMPRIAVSTGVADALECLVRKLGIDDSEFGTAGNAASIHLYATTGPGQGTRMGTFGTFALSGTQLWNATASLMPYDMVMLSCEGMQNPLTKPTTSMVAMKDYADAGGRIFASHYHNIWIDGDPSNPAHAPPVWPAIAMFADDGTAPSGDILIDPGPHASTFTAWQTNVSGIAGGRISMPLGSGSTTAMSVSSTLATRWTYFQHLGSERPQNFSFTAPVETTDRTQHCGRVAFSDMHMGGSAQSMPNVTFPNGCGAAVGFTPQEFALVYLLFDLQSCVGGTP